MTLAASKAEGAVGRQKAEIQGVFVVRDGKARFVPVQTGISRRHRYRNYRRLDRKGTSIVTGSYKALRTLTPGRQREDRQFARPRPEETSSSS